MIGAELQDKFREHYGARARIYRAPGRVNLIGEHTDYNEGLVMPAAIDFYVWVGVSPRNDRRLLVYSENFSESIEIDLRKDKLRPRKHWSDYVAGVASMLEQAQCHLQGANLLIHGEVPIGSGLSSSAAVELKRIPSMAIARDQLVHDADPGSDELVFGALADPGEIESID